MQLDGAYRIASIRGLYRIAARILDIEIAPSPLGTAHTDGSKIVIDPRMLERISAEECLFVAAHEYYHIIYDHVRRGQMAGYNGRIHNVACDAIINEHLVAYLGLKRPSKEIGGIFRDDPLFEGMPDTCDTSDKIYAWLVRNSKHPQDGDDMGDMQGSEKEADADPHDAQRNRADRLAEGCCDKKASKEINIVLGRDDRPNDGDDWIDLLTAIRINSGRLVRREIAHNYSRPSRREEPAGVCLPASRHIVAMPRVDVYIDVSGSMGEAPLAIFSGIRSILSHMAIYRPRFFAFNTRIRTIDIKASRFEMGGGTDIKKVLDKISTDKADLAIVITDCCDNVTRADFAKNVVVVSNNRAMSDYFTTDWKKVKGKKSA